MGDTILNSNRYSKALKANADTAVSRHDQVSGFLVASVGLVGLTTGLLALVLFLNMEWDKSLRPPMFVFKEFAGFEKPEGIAQDFREPGVEELSEVDEPQLADAIEMVTQAVSTTRSAIKKVDGPAVKQGAGVGDGDRRKRGTSDRTIGDSKSPAQHWVIRYSTSNKESYAEQIDFFKIEIGSLSKQTSLIEYTAEVTSPNPIYKQGTRKDERRVFFRKPEKHPVLRWDKAFLKAAGAEVADRYILTFYPDATYQKLLELEKNALKRDNKQRDDIRRTVFTVEPNKAGGFEYKLSSIKYY